MYLFNHQTTFAQVTLDGDSSYARGTPLERPKIGNSILDVIGATPIVSFILI